MDSARCQSLDQFQVWLEAQPGRLDQFLDQLAINVTELFRNPDRWAELEEYILPRLTKAGRSLKIWSAGCSYGAEPFTIAAILHRSFPGIHRIVATDIDSAALAQAERAEFSTRDARFIPPTYAGMFPAVDSDQVTADPALRRMIEFRKHNLFSEPIDTEFDLIVCRNVVIYLTDKAKHELFIKFFRSLKPGGVLFVGSTERIFNASQIGFETDRPFYYRKPTMEFNQCRNAS